MSELDEQIQELLTLGMHPFGVAARLSCPIEWVYISMEIHAND